MVVYKITNLVNGKVYVGRTNDLGRRWKEHCAGRDSHKSAIDLAIKKYGSGSFQIEVLEGGLPDDATLNDRERFWISALKSTTREGGYNITLGGEGTLGRRHSEATKLKISAANSGRVRSDEVRHRMSLSRVGRRHSAAHCAAISSAKTGRRFADTTPWQKPRSAAYKEACRAARRRDPRTRLIAYQGERHPISEWARRIGISPALLKYRLDKQWPIEKAMTQTVRGEVK